MNFSILIQVGGGLGLLLLGMKHMTDGLKLAAGGWLRKVLGRWTRTPLRGLASGFAITSAVQSSSAVTVAAIGFLNAGLMSLENAVWVVYGSNVGTTTTAWIVAFLGLKVNIKAMALPLVAVGAMLWVLSRRNRQAALGEALAGFGLFFLGVEMLQGAFTGLGQEVNLQALALPGWAGVLEFTGIGFGLTFIMQSSSAAMALVLTAAAGGMITPELAAAGVIGANVGTTSTAALAAIGATPGAKRLAAVHVAFNLLTGALALVLIHALMGLIMWGRAVLGLASDTASELAMFHTIFNTLGVAVMWPLTSRLTGYVGGLFVTAEEDEGRLRHLDSNVVRTPALALNALLKEVGRIGEVSRRSSMAAIACGGGDCREFSTDKAILDRLLMGVGRFSAKLSKEGLSQDTADKVPRVLRACQYFNASLEMALDALNIGTGLEEPADVSTREAMEGVRQGAGRLLAGADGSAPDFVSEDLQVLEGEFEARYQRAKARLLEAGSTGLVPIEDMVGWLDYFSRIRRMVEQSAKAAHLLHNVTRALSIRSQTQPAA